MKIWNCNVVYSKVEHFPQKHGGVELILLFWKKKEMPTVVKLWLTELTETLHLERIRFILQNKLSNFK